MASGFTPMRTNDGSQKLPRLEPFLNLDTLQGLPSWSRGPVGSESEVAETIRNAGYRGVQGVDIAHWRDYGLNVATLGRVNSPGEIAPLAARWKSEGYTCASLHVGWGFEDNDLVDRLVDEIVATSVTVGIPLYIETHRATIAQDPWRTLRFIERNPDVRFNGDFSHWYTGLEFVYGDFESKLDLIQPVFSRVGFMHGRVGNGGHIQVPLADPSMSSAIAHYREMWTRAMRGFVTGAAAGDYLIFAPELLQSSINYARLYRTSEGTWEEDSDRWQESLELVAIAQSCFKNAADDAR